LQINQDEVIGDKISAGERWGKQSRNYAAIQWKQGRKNPHQNAVLSGLWTDGSKWAPFSFFRLFCTFRTCTQKPGKAPVYKAVGSKNIFQSRTWQGQQYWLLF